MKEKDNKNFITNNRGAVAIEFIFMMFLLSIMFAFMTDLVTMRSTVGKLERTSYSLLNVIKERVAFGKDPKKPFVADEVYELQELAQKLIYGDAKKGKVDVIVEYLELEPDSSNKSERKVKKKYYNQVSSKKPSKDCVPITPLSQLHPLSPRAEVTLVGYTEPRYVPVYQVTVCTEMGSLFTELTNHFVVDKRNKSATVFRSSSAGVTR